MTISTSGASSFRRDISVSLAASKLRRPGLFPSTIFVIPLTLAYWAIAVAGSFP